MYTDYRIKLIGNSKRKKQKLKLITGRLIFNYKMYVSKRIFYIRYICLFQKFVKITIFCIIFIKNLINKNLKKKIILS